MAALGLNEKTVLTYYDKNTIFIFLINPSSTRFIVTQSEPRKIKQTLQLIHNLETTVQRTPITKLYLHIAVDDCIYI